jgi:hypothetical protein
MPSRAVVESVPTVALGSDRDWCEGVLEDNSARMVIGFADGPPYPIRIVVPTKRRKPIRSPGTSSIDIWCENPPLLVARRAAL